MLRKIVALTVVEKVDGRVTKRSGKLKMKSPKRFDISPSTILTILRNKDDNILRE